MVGEEELTFQETIQDALGKENLENLEIKRPSVILDRNWTCEQKKRKRDENALLFLEVKFNASVFMFLWGWKGNLSSNSFLSVGWNPSYCLLLTILWERKGKFPQKPTQYCRVKLSAFH